jgi:UDP-glucose 4-epimerase
MRILVTGGAGFIGSHVCDALLAQGHEVAALDDLSSGKRENLDHRVRLLVADIRGADAAAHVERLRPEVICHLAAQISVSRSVSDPKFDADCNIAGLLNILEAARRAGVRRVVFSSTGGAIYGEQDIYPAPESHPVRPASPYGCAKAAGEIYLNYFQQQYGIAYAALRYANVYGPRQNPHGEAGVVAIFAHRVLAGEPLTVFGDGKQTRDMVFVEDVVRANLAASDVALPPVDGIDARAFNVGTGVETSVNELAATLVALAGNHLAIHHAPARPGELRRNALGVDKAARGLRWRANVAIAEGLRRTLQSFKEG